ncbi:MAG TPA: ADP-heptose synthase [Rhodospirillales bacterium]|nr:ADP-heptose synthase [Rhodospirillales bacterium]
MSRELEDIKASILGGLRVSFVSGKFNVIHPGHIRLFRFAREISDYLVVGIFEDGSSNGLVIAEEERLEGVTSNTWVDAAFILREDLPSTIKQLKPDIVVKGTEHENRDNPELAAVEEYGGVVHFASGNTSFSSLELLQSEISTSRDGLIRHADRYLSRHNISLRQLNSTIKKMSEIRTLVIGDLIVDRYIDCEPIGMSSEDPSLVVSPLLTQTFVGGAGIVAAHSASLGGETHFISVCGDDEDAEYARNRLEKSRVKASCITDLGRPTTSKTRYRADGQTMLRVNNLRDHEISNHIADQMLGLTLDLLSEIDLLILSDFSYGVFTNDLIAKVTHASRQQNIIIVADSQSSSQFGDIGRFTDVTLITPTEKEARLAVKDKRGGLVKVAEELQSLVNARDVVLTLGSEGAFLRAKTREVNMGQDDRIPALNRDPKDVAGAGDAFLVGSALSTAMGVTIWEAAYVGSMAAACQIGRIGNIPLRVEEMVNELLL